MARITACLLAAFTGSAIALPSAYTRVLHEQRSGNVHSSWTRNGRVESTAIIPLRIGLTQNNLADGETHIWRISDPGSADFGKHMSAEDVHDLFAPSASTVELVMQWLIESGISRNDFVQSENKGWIAAEIPASEVERLFSSEVYEYEHKRTGEIRLGCDSYHLPAHLVQHIDYVTPGVKFSMALKKRPTDSIKKRDAQLRPSKPSLPITSDFWLSNNQGDPLLPDDLKYCDLNITVSCIRALYNIPKGTKNLPGNECGVFEQGSYFNDQDLDLNYGAFNSGVPQGTRPNVVSIDGGVAPRANDYNAIEAILDIYLITALTYPQSVTVYQVDDQYYEPIEDARVNTFNTFLDALDGSYCDYSAYGITGDSPTIDPQYPDNHTGGYQGQRQCGTYKATRVISISYAESELDLPKNYVLRQCNEFMKLALQGHTLLVSSGDFGVGSLLDDPSASGCLGNDETIYNPEYPSGCPWITSVGGTQIFPGQNIHEPESALQTPLSDTGVYAHFSSSGGFSNYFPTASYQQAAVNSYFASHDPGHPSYMANSNASNIGQNGGLYNRGGRGYPDVSANGAYLLVYANSLVAHRFGTSLSAPIWASVITLINAERATIGKGPVGFINPTLYASPSALNDIRNGSNPNCGSSGFQAVEGWDPITGLGTPNYPKLKALFLALP